MEAVFVSRKEVQKGLVTLKNAFLVKPPPDIIIWCQKGLLNIKAGGCHIKLPALGEWEGQAQLPIKGIKLITRALPKVDPIPFIKYEDSLGIGHVRLYCSWAHVSKEQISIPINAQPVLILGYLKNYSNEELEASGVLWKCLAADQERIERINSAKKILTPLGVTMNDLIDLVDKAVDRAFELNH
jgi:hypothetical protein